MEEASFGKLAEGKGYMQRQQKLVDGEDEKDQDLD
jgi:hypothetical protein